MANIQIFVRLFDGRTVTLNRDPEDTIDDVMRAIEDMEGIPVAEQRIIFGGRQLDRNQTLSQLGIQGGSTLHLVGRVFGGAQIQALRGGGVQGDRREDPGTSSRIA